MLGYVVFQLKRLSILSDFTVYDLKYKLCIYIETTSDDISCWMLTILKEKLERFRQDA